MTHCKNLRFLDLLAVALSCSILSASTPAAAQGVGTNYCTTSPNSVGAGAVISASGSAGVALNNLTLRADALPTGQFGMFFYGSSQASLPMGNGVLCVGAGMHRLNPALNSGSGGVITHALDVNATPVFGGVILAGSTWNFQAWYRDSAAGGARYNFSDGLQVQFSSGVPPYSGMVLVPAGAFTMGDHAGVGDPEEVPLHDVTLDAFYMDVYEVTSIQYAAYLNQALAAGKVTVAASGVVIQAAGAGQALCDTTGSAAYSRITWDGATFGVVNGKERHPMVQLSWYGSSTYCNWRSEIDGLVPCYDETNWACDHTANGYRLPTESEWEYAARGGQAGPYEIYPWGDTIDGSQANFGGSADPWDNVGAPETTPVGYYNGNQTPAGTDMVNGYGLYDMSGNIWDWCGDWYGIYTSSPSVNPTGPAWGSRRVVRGGSWTDGVLLLRSAHRCYFTPTARGRSVGFRAIAKGL